MALMFGKTAPHQPSPRDTTPHMSNVGSKAGAKKSVKARPDVERGFVLVLTIWIVAAIGLVVVAVNAWVTQAVNNAGAMQQLTADQIAHANIRNELIYAIGTRPLSYRGLETGRLMEKIDPTDANAMMTADFKTDRYMQLNGLAYRSESHPEYVIQLFDGRGLVNLNNTSAPYLRRMLALFDVPENVANSLVDALEDYTDRDDLTRISGAEAREYKRLGREEPANAWLVTPLEAQSILNWDTLGKLWAKDADTPLFSACVGAGFNPNTAPREVLISNFAGLDEAGVAEILKRQNERPFRNIRELSAAANIAVRDDPFFFTFSPGSCLVIELTHEPTGNRTRFSLTIDTFSAKTKPWRVDYAFPIPSRPQESIGKLDPDKLFPTPESLVAYERQDGADDLSGSSGDLGFEPVSNAPPNR
jgi:general secretion pathway protein K